MNFHGISFFVFFCLSFCWLSGRIETTNRSILSWTMASEDKELEKTIAEDLVVTKYKLAGEIVNSKKNQIFYISDWLSEFTIEYWFEVQEFCKSWHFLQFCWSNSMISIILNLMMIKWKISILCEIESDFLSLAVAITAMFTLHTQHKHAWKPRGNICVSLICVHLNYCNFRQFNWIGSLWFWARFLKFSLLSIH